MPSEMVERVARAIWEAHSKDDQQALGWDDLRGSLRGFRERKLVEARAAIKAMLMPTLPMVGAAVDAVEEKRRRFGAPPDPELAALVAPDAHSDAWRGSRETEACFVWGAMIHAALSEEEGGDWLTQS